MLQQESKTRYLCEECYETWTGPEKEKSCPYCGSDMITPEKKKA
jgi:rubrerythrin